MFWVSWNDKNVEKSDGVWNEIASEMANSRTLRCEIKKLSKEAAQEQAKKTALRSEVQALTTMLCDKETQLSALKINKEALKKREEALTTSIAYSNKRNTACTSLNQGFVTVNAKILALLKDRKQEYREVKKLLQDRGVYVDADGF
jgi:ribosomal protein L18E